MDTIWAGCGWKSICGFYASLISALMIDHIENIFAITSAGYNLDCVLDLYYLKERTIVSINYFLGESL